MVLFPVIMVNSQILFIRKFVLSSKFLFKVEDSAEVVENPVHDAAKRGNQDFLIECLTNGVSVNGLDKAGNTPLIWASHGGHVNCMNTLLEYPNVELNVQVFVHLHTLGLRLK